jgi:flagellar biosynthesis protein FlhA
MDPAGTGTTVKGIPTKEPAFGLDAIWITEGSKAEAQLAGLTVVDLSTVVTTHLTELIKAHMADLLGRQEVQSLLDNLAKEYPKVVEDLVPTILSLGQVQQVLTRLLKEQISIRDLRTILETLADAATNTKSPERLTELVRRKFARSICSKLSNSENTLSLVTLNGASERRLTESLTAVDDGSILAIDPATAQVLISRLTQTSQRFLEAGATPVLLVPSQLRPALANFVERFVPGYVVVSHSEVTPQTKVHSFGVISLEVPVKAAA